MITRLTWLFRSMSPSPFNVGEPISDGPNVDLSIREGRDLLANSKNHHFLLLGRTKCNTKGIKKAI